MYKKPRKTERKKEQRGYSFAAKENRKICTLEKDEYKKKKNQNNMLSKYYHECNSFRLFRRIRLQILLAITGNDIEAKGLNFM